MATRSKPMSMSCRQQSTNGKAKCNSKNKPSWSKPVPMGMC